MNGFWIPLVFIIFETGNPMSRYDATVVLENKQQCLYYAKFIMEDTITEIIAESNTFPKKAFYNCIFIPDNKKS